MYQFIHSFFIIIHNLYKNHHLIMFIIQNPHYYIKIQIISMIVYESLSSFHQTSKVHMYVHPLYVCFYSRTIRICIALNPLQTSIKVISTTLDFAAQCIITMQSTRAGRQTLI